MSREFLTNIDLNKNSLLNAAIQTLASAPSSPVTGQIYFDTTAGTLRQYDGTQWLNYVSAENGTEFIQSVDSNFIVNTGQLSLASNVTVTNSLTASTLSVKDDSSNTQISLDAVSHVANFYNGVVQIGAIDASTDDFVVKAWQRHLSLVSNNGNIELNADGNVVLFSNLTTNGEQSITAGGNIYAGNTLYVGGTTSGYNGTLDVQGGDGNSQFTVSVNEMSGTGLTLHGRQNLYTATYGSNVKYGQIDYDSGNNLVITASHNDVILNPASGYAYIGNNSSPATRIATQGYVDGVAQGLNVKESVVTATTDNYDLATVITNPILVVIGGWGGPGLDWGSRVLLLGQTDPTQNGIYVLDETAQGLIRAADQQTPEQGDFAFVELGTNGARGYIVQQSNNAGVFWTQFSAAGQYVAGNGIDISGTTISVKLDSDSLSESSSGLKVNYHTDGGLDNDSGLYVKTATGVTIDTSGNVALDINNGYGVRKYAANNLSLSAISGAVTWTVTHNFNTLDVTVQVRELSGNSLVEVDVVITDANTVTLSWVSGDVSADSYRVVVVG